MCESTSIVYRMDYDENKNWILLKNRFSNILQFSLIFWNKYPWDVRTSEYSIFHLPALGT